MDDYLFITMAKLKSDRLRLEREQRATDEASEPRKQPMESPRAAVEGAVMRTTLTVAAAVVINVLALGVLSWSVSENRLSPHGEVTITQIEE